VSHAKVETMWIMKETLWKNNLKGCTHDICKFCYNCNYGNGKR
jgi:hypothetical protein